MNTREQLNQYLRGLETRLRWMAVSKGVAIAAGVALGATSRMVLVHQRARLFEHQHHHRPRRSVPRPRHLPRLRPGFAITAVERPRTARQPR